MLNNINTALFPHDIFYKENFLGIALCIIATFHGMAIFKSDTTLVSDSLFSIFVVLNIALATLALVLSPQKVCIQSKLLFIALSAYWLVYVLHPAAGVESGLGLTILFYAFFFSVIPKDQFLVAIRLYSYIFFVICAFGIIAYVSYVFHLGIPYETVPYYTVSESSLYINYNFSYLVVNLSDTMLRLCGLFNEPGYLGTFAAFILIINKFRLTFQNIVIFIAAFMTFSMAFYVLIIIYWGLRAITERQKTPTIIFVAYIIFNIVIPNVHFENSNYEELLNRFTIVNGQLEGDNRVADDFEKFYKSAMRNPQVAMFGLGHGIQTAKNIMSVSYTRWILQYGYVGFVFFFGMFFIYGYKLSRYSNDKPCSPAIIYLIIFYINMYQRPYLYDNDYILLLFGGIMLLVKEEEQKIQLKTVPSIK